MGRSFDHIDLGVPRLAEDGIRGRASLSVLPCRTLRRGIRTMRSSAKYSKNSGTVQRAPFFRDGLKPSADGSFEIPGILPDTYRIFATIPGGDGAPVNAGSLIRTDQESPVEPPAPVNIGELPLTTPAAFKPYCGCVPATLHGAAAARYSRISLVSFRCMSDNNSSKEFQPTGQTMLILFALFCLVTALRVTWLTAGMKPEELSAFRLRDRPWLKKAFPRMVFVLNWLFLYMLTFDGQRLVSLAGWDPPGWLNILVSVFFIALSVPLVISAIVWHAWRFFRFRTSPHGLIHLQMAMPPLLIIGGLVWITSYSIIHGMFAAPQPSP
ncbi:MAG: hypothetical protein JWM59_1980 [Verrucomicrobiales bacterium]|nr:hypothetical protein [Verrucomicrobiales bacterium]